MKRILTSVVSIVAGCMISAYASGITINANRQPAEKVFASIMKQSGKNFIYPSGLLKGITVSVNKKDAPLSEVLDQMLKETGITYRIRGNSIMLMKQKPQKAPAEKACNATLSGFVREAGTGEPLTGVVVTTPDGEHRTVSNNMGFYSLTLPCGKQQVIAIFPGFENSASEVLSLNKSRSLDLEMNPQAEMLQELIVEDSPNRMLAMESASIGAVNISREAIKTTPVVFGEADVIKTLQMEPGVTAGIEGAAGMYVHGGNTDENLYMLDNIPLYQVNHLGGLFSAFNVEAIRNVDFYKSSFPASYDGRLSSFIDVRTKDGGKEGHHGSAKLGLTSGAFDINGPFKNGKTTYSLAIRRSWYDVLTIPAMAIVNSFTKDEKNSFGYAFTDLNAKITHRFSDRSKGYVMAYYGEDYLRVSQSFDKNKDDSNYEENKHNLRWGNIVASAGWNYVFSDKIFGEVTAAYTRYFSRLNTANEYGEKEGGVITEFSRDKLSYDNNINDWIIKADFDWRPHPATRLTFGAGYTHHSFLPARTRRTITTESVEAGVTDLVTSYRANEMNAYFGGDWQPSENWRVNYGLHYSLFNITGKTHHGLSPRLSAKWSPADYLSVKAGYSRTTQYVHQLLQSSISLPTDQWVPVIGGQKPQTADKISLGLYWKIPGGFTFSVEGYWKWMRNLLEYMEEYYLLPPDMAWNDKLTPGKGTSKGIDFKLSKEFGRVTGQLSYSLLWADRQYEKLNGGRPFPARFDNRHSINVLVNWKINDKWDVTGAWTGMSGNRFTLPLQCWNDPSLGPWHYTMWRKTDVNNYRLPFYHRLDLSARRQTKHGYWTFSLYNAYCNLNTIAVRLDYSNNVEWNPETKDYDLKPAYQKIKLIPLIPSVSYTWLF